MRPPAYGTEGRDAKIQTDIDPSLLLKSANALHSLRFMTVTQGMSTSARDGAMTAQLKGMADAAIRVWSVKNDSNSPESVISVY